MIIDLQAVADETHVHEMLDQGWWKVTDPSQQVLGLEGPLQVEVKVSKAADKFLVEGTLEGKVRIRCDRCLEAFGMELKSAFNVYLVVRPSGRFEEDLELLEEDMEVEFLDGETIDLDHVIREQIYLSVPMKCLCRSDCRGLCSQCGANLNVAPCSCKSGLRHAAFSKLENLKLQGE